MKIRKSPCQVTKLNPVADYTNFQTFNLSETANENENYVAPVLYVRAATDSNRGGRIGIAVVDSLGQILVRMSVPPAPNNSSQLAEVIALYQALRLVPTGQMAEDFEVKSTNQYALSLIKAGWLAKWERNGYRNSSGKPIAHYDEIKLLVATYDPRSLAKLTWCRKSKECSAQALAKAVATQESIQTLSKTF